LSRLRIVVFSLPDEAISESVTSFSSAFVMRFVWSDRVYSWFSVKSGCVTVSGSAETSRFTAMAIATTIADATAA